MSVQQAAALPSEDDWDRSLVVQPDQEHHHHTPRNSVVFPAEDTPGRATRFSSAEPRQQGKRTLSELLRLHSEKACDGKFSPEEASRIADVLGQWINASSSPYEGEDDFFNKRPTFIDSSPTTSRDGANRSEKRVDFASLAPRKVKASKHSVPMAMRPQNHIIEEEEEEDMRKESLVDTQRMQLISPPPEETLRRNSRLSAQFTPSLLATVSSPGPVQGSTTKRKRLQRAHAPSSSVGTIDNATAAGSTEAQQAIEATPNPKPRKQGRHTRVPSTEVESPTRGSFTLVARSPTKSESGRRRDINTTPSKPKRVIVQSPHAANPDADFILPVSLSFLSAAPARRAVLGARASRRSATPIPPYEPPTDVFTPPREVFMSPVPKTISKSSKRKTPATTKANTRKSRVSNLSVVTTQVKKEIPDDIDLMAPMPPPSPSDDPLLLSGPPEPPIESSPSRRPAARRHSVSIPAQNEMMLPPSSPEPPLDSEDIHAVKTFEWNRLADGSMDTEEDSMMDDPRDRDVAPVKLFDFDNLEYGSGDVGGWSDSDEEVELDKGKGKELGEFEEEGEGEYTGKWKMMRVPTKQDPPSSATRTRMELWGRPISPFPFSKDRLDLVGEEEEEEAKMRRKPAELMGPTVSRDRSPVEQELDIDEHAREEEQVQNMSVGPEEAVDPPVPSVFEEVYQRDEEDEEEERQVREMSIEVDDEDDDGPSNQEILLPETPEFIREPSPVPTVADVPPVEIVSSHSVESLEASHSSLNQDSQTLVDEESQMQGVASEFQDAMEDDEGDSISDMEDMPGFVKITSADPRAAARAAAILKQHDYDCFTRIIERGGKRRRASHSGVDDLAKESRRRDVTASGITKSVSKNKRRSTLGMGVIGDHVFIPGTPVTTLPELLKEAEVEVGRELEHDHRDDVRLSSELWPIKASLTGSGQRDPFKTPLPDRHRARASATNISVQSTLYDSGERPWTKEEWKLLDACFTDERLDLGVALEDVPEGTLAPVDMVSVDDVVERFVCLVGGEGVTQVYGDAWSRESVTQRTLALQRKQRAGNVARPTTPRSVSFTFSPSVPLSSKGAGALGGKNRIPSMEVPDFTPLGRRSGPPRRSRPALPQPLGQDAPFANLPVEVNGSASRRVPPTLLAPRYSHLLDEAKLISQGDVTNLVEEDLTDHERDVSSSSSNVSFGLQVDNQDDSCLTPQLDVDTRNHTIGKRVKGFLFSYLPSLSSKSSASFLLHKQNTIRQPGLPLPPPNLLEKVRGPVTTPARQPLPKPIHPKELVQLHPAPPSAPSALPRPTKPQRLVELHPLPPLAEKPIVTQSASVRPRRSSGASVKDLVKGFERLEKEKLDSNPLRKVRSIGDIRKKHNSSVDTRPRWKF
ncbi:hypothetical protein CPB84DRAFT_1838218 [Gymnopilus junonius]|uniref:Uncharacterized protein n=1 Tax=Gymnopilus junonius TaxID=109634 RepID=A0A9P5TJ25_GYMJU|nr:hypothetical protein CPB84DRAFT_1838218 [Gymnopilus junonius]